MQTLALNGLYIAFALTDGRTVPPTLISRGTRSDCVHGVGERNQGGPNGAVFCANMQRRAGPLGRAHGKAKAEQKKHKTNHK